MSRPNILYILTDQQSASMLSCMGNKNLSTPAMDSLADKGTLFTRAYCSNPVCIPSRVSLFSGHYPSYIGIWQNTPKAHIPDDFLENGLGHVLRKVGYKTLYGGKQHFASFCAEDIGFEVYSYDERWLLAQSARDILLSYQDSQPFFMVVSLINPHDICYHAIKEYTGEHEHTRLLAQKSTVVKETLEMVMKNIEKYEDNELPELPDNFAIQKDEPQAIKELIKERPFKQQARDSWSERKWREHRYAYCRLTELVDSQIAMILEAVPENTLIIFTSDHGDHDSSHKLEHKSTFYEEVTNIPLIIVPPNANMSNKQRSSSLVSNAFDLYATICDYAEAQIPKDLEEMHSLKNIVQHNSESDTILRKELKIECQLGTAYHTGDTILVNYNLGKSEQQFYDLRLDPGQTQSHNRN